MISIYLNHMRTFIRLGRVEALHPLRWTCVGVFVKQAGDTLHSSNEPNRLWILAKISLLLISDVNFTSMNIVSLFVWSSMTHHGKTYYQYFYEPIDPFKWIFFYITGSCLSLTMNVGLGLLAIHVDPAWNPRHIRAKCWKNNLSRGDHCVKI
jgi:hypothetical protein